MNNLVENYPLGFLDTISVPNLGPLLLNLAGAAGILFLGTLIAWFVSNVVQGLLRQTDLDNRLASAVTGSASSKLDIEKILGGLAFWVVMLVALVAALNVLNLNTVSQPLNAFLGTIFEFLPKLGAALALTGLAWVVATVLKGLVIQSARSFDLDSKVTSASSDSTIVLSETLGNALYWFVFLFFLPLILGALGLQSSLGPVNDLLQQVLSALPKILKAVMIGGAGWFVANIVRGIVSNLTAATGVDSIGEQVGLSRASTGQSLSSLLGTVTYVLVLIPTVTAALGALEIPAIANPATNMLNQVMNTIPLIFTAGAILGIAYFVGKFLADLATSLLRGFGFDNVMGTLGLQQGSRAEGTQSPSEIAGLVVLVGTMLFAAIAAIDVLNLPALKLVFTALLAIAGQVLVGALIFAVGLYLANFAAKFIQASGVPQANTLATVARVVILAFTGAMALERAGVSTNIVNLAFGLLLGAVAVAIAIAFGLGGRDVAGETLRDWVKPFKK
jgi:Conserved TM helix